MQMMVRKVTVPRAGKLEGCCMLPHSQGIIHADGSQGRTERLFPYILSKEASNKVSECTEILVSCGNRLWF